MIHTFLEMIPNLSNAAQQTTQTAGPATGSNFFTSPLFMLAVMAVMFLVLLIPQRKQEKELKKLQESLAVGDEVMLHSGLFGSISSIEENTVTIEFGSNKTVRIPVSKNAIAGKVNQTK